METVVVHQATARDLTALVPLFDAYRCFYQRPSDLEGARAFLAERFRYAESVIFLAHEDVEPIGFTQLYPSFSSAAMAPIFILNDLFVRESTRGRGVARKLIGAAVDFAGVAGAVRLTLSTAATNGPAQALYESLAWQRDEQFFVYHFAP